MTQTELAKQSGVSQTHIGGILRKESSCTIEMADALAAPFGLTGWQLIMPNLPDDLVGSQALQRFFDTYIGTDDAGREFMDAAVKMTKPRK